ncbi:MAG TPA: hypothetical protein PKC68_03250 [Alphaproteobacteria bacterium]|nr:hypothetical protein [Alphaproteobacteria bacterium]
MKLPSFLLKLAIVSALSLTTSATSVFGETTEIKIPQQEWGFTSLFGTFDRAAQQRGFQGFRALPVIQFQNYLIETLPKLVSRPNR